MAFEPTDSQAREPSHNSKTQGVRKDAGDGERRSRARDTEVKNAAKGNAGLCAAALTQNFFQIQWNADTAAGPEVETVGRMQGYLERRWEPCGRGHPAPLKKM